MSKRSERKKREEEERKRQEQMRRQMLLMQQQQRLMMQRQQQAGPNGMSYGPMNGNAGLNPCAMPSRFIQLTPIIQPIAMVPYSTQNQPLLMYNGNFGNNNNDPGGFGTYNDPIPGYPGYDAGFEAGLGRAFQSFTGSDDDYI